MNAPRGAVLGKWAGRRCLFSWRGVDVPSYPAMLYLGCVAGVFAGAGVASSAGLDRSRVALATIVLLIPAFAGARLWFVLEHWSVYRREPRRIWRRSEGGAALHGGLLLSVAVSVPLLALVELPFWRLTGQGLPAPDPLTGGGDGLARAMRDGGAGRRQR